MKLFDLAKSFAKDESGAVTVDWVVLTAGIVTLGLLVTVLIRPAIQGLSERIAGAVDAVEVTP